MPKYSILIADESSSIRNFEKQILYPLDSKIYEASNGKEAYDIALKEPIDIIITDIEMPELDGVELCYKLKNNIKTKTIPIIILSGFDEEADISRGYNAGAEAYISKEEARVSLFSTVQDILSKSVRYRNQLIMIVDDSKPLLDLLSENLNKSGFNVSTALNGKEALTLLKTTNPDLILSDIQMPDMDGIELLDNIQKESRLAAIPFVVMSTIDKRAYIKRLIQKGAAAYLVKPFNLDQLTTLLEKILTDQFTMLLKEKERLDSERNMLLGSITSLVSALEARDPYTRGHSEAVAEIFSSMVKLSGGTQEDVEMAYIAGQLHDIGKIGVRDTVLLKKGRLTTEEFDHIKQHPVIGSNILKAIPSLKEVANVVLSHHERFDGKGYPNQLKGKKIPLWARFTAVADTYHALTSNRPYRKGMEKGMAFDILNDVSGTQLDPDSVSLFFQYIKSKAQ